MGDTSRRMTRNWAVGGGLWAVGGGLRAVGQLTLMVDSGRASYGALT